MRTSIAAFAAGVTLAVIPLSVLQLSTAGASRVISPRTPAAVTVQACRALLAGSQGTNYSHLVPTSPLTGIPVA